MDTNRLTYLVKVFFENTASQEEQEELAATVKRANGDAYLKKILEQVWENYKPEQKMPEDMSDRILGKLFVQSVNLTNTTEYEISNLPEPALKRIRVWRYTAIAASFTLVVSLGWWLLKTNPAKGANHAQRSRDIHPKRFALKSSFTRWKYRVVKCRQYS